MTGRRADQPLCVAFFGSSLVSAYWNGAATYYRGIIRALHERGHRVTFYEPTDAWEGIEQFLEPGREVLVARDGDEVARHQCALGCRINRHGRIQWTGASVTSCSSPAASRWAQRSAPVRRRRGTGSRDAWR